MAEFEEKNLDGEWFDNFLKGETYQSIADGTYQVVRYDQYKVWSYMYVDTLRYEKLNEGEGEETRVLAKELRNRSLYQGI